jgi:TRAP-type mannitol/chloroaromatic compound transport system permease large subunit
MWMMVAAYSFRALYFVSGASDLVYETFMAVPGGKWGAIIASQAILFVLGLCLDEFEILIITVPIFIPVMKAFGVDLLWFGIMFVINMEIAEISPPLGMNLFCMKAVMGKDTPMEQIWQSVLPFIGMMSLAIAIIMVFPEITTYLPNTLITRGR